MQVGGQALQGGGVTLGMLLLAVNGQDVSSQPFAPKVQVLRFAARPVTLRFLPPKTEAASAAEQVRDALTTL
jgi:hypothetical protein